MGKIFIEEFMKKRGVSKSYIRGECIYEILDCCKNYFGNYFVDVRDNLFKLGDLLLDVYDEKLKEILEALKNANTDEKIKKLAISYYINNSLKEDQKRDPKGFIMLLKARSIKHARAFIEIFNHSKFKESDGIYNLLNVMNGCDEGRINIFKHIIIKALNYNPEHIPKRFAWIIEYINKNSKNVSTNWVDAALALRIDENKDFYFKVLDLLPKSPKKLKSLYNLFYSLTSGLHPTDRSLEVIKVFVKYINNYGETLGDLCTWMLFHRRMENDTRFGIFNKIKEAKYESQVAVLHTIVNWGGDLPKSASFVADYVISHPRDASYNGVHFFMYYLDSFPKSWDSIFPKIINKSEYYIDTLWDLKRYNISITLYGDKYFEQYFDMFLDTQSIEELNMISSFIISLYSKLKDENSLNDEERFNQISEKVKIIMKSNNKQETLEMITKEKLGTSEIAMVSKYSERNAYLYIDLIASSEKFQSLDEEERKNIIKLLCKTHIYKLYFGGTIDYNNDSLVLRVIKSSNYSFEILERIINILDNLNNAFHSLTVYKFAYKYLSENTSDKLNDRNIYYFECICKAYSEEQAGMLYELFTSQKEYHQHELAHAIYLSRLNIDDYRRAVSASLLPSNKETIPMPIGDLIIPSEFKLFLRRYFVTLEVFDKEKLIKYYSDNRLRSLFEIFMDPSFIKFDLECNDFSSLEDRINKYLGINNIKCLKLMNRHNYPYNT